MSQPPLSRQIKAFEAELGTALFARSTRGVRVTAAGAVLLTVGFCRDAGFTPRIEQEAIQMPTIVSLVAAGMGVSLVPASLRHMRRSGVVYRALTQTSPLMEVGVAWRHGDVEPAVAAFVNH